MSNDEWKNSWLSISGNTALEHPAASIACARMRVRVFEAVAESWIHPVELSEKGTTRTLYVVAQRQGMRSYVAPTADSRQISTAERKALDGWEVTGHEADFRSWEPISLKNRAIAGGPFVYETPEEAAAALAEMLFEGAALSLASQREEGTLEDAVRSWIDLFHSHVTDRSGRYKDMPG
jgi:hypothetical protein